MSSPNTFVLFRPRVFHNTAEVFYTELKCVLDERRFKYIDVMSRGNGQDAHPYLSKDFVRMTWHTSGFSERQWHLNRAPLPGFIEFDTEGYAGFSSVCSHQCAKRIDQLDLLEADHCFTRFANDYISSGRTKFQQPPRREDVLLPHPYVFVPLQVPGDSVLRLSTLTPYQLCNLVIEKTIDTHYSVVIKQHPRDPNNLNLNLLAENRQLNEVAGFTKLRRNIEQGRCLLRNWNIHDLISGAEAIFTVNSGVGLEALLHRKPVFTWGESLYKYASARLPNVIDLPFEDLLRYHPFDQNRAARLFFHLFTETFGPVRGRLGAERLVQRVMGENPTD